MFDAWGTLVHRYRWAVLVGVVIATVGAGVWGLGVFDRLTQGGWEDPSAESAQVNRIIEQQLGRRSDLAVLYTAPAGSTIDDPALAAKVTASLRALPADAVANVSSYWDQHRPDLTDQGKQHALATITLKGDDYDTRHTAYDQIADRLAVDGVQTQVGGRVPTEDALTERSTSDLTFAESISMPVTLILLVVIFGSLVAAALPVVVGGLAIFGSLGLLHGISLGVPVNTFAVNVATLLGLGLAIDYGLFSVGRFREELAAGASTADAVRTTVATAGRTVAFSATLLILALAGLLVFPMDFLRSMAYGGMSAVAVAAVISLTVLPAAMAILGRRIDRFSVPWRRRGQQAESSTFLRKLADAVLRRPILFAAPIVAGLVLLALPFTGASYGAADEKQLPPGEPARVTAEAISANFPQFSNRSVQVLVRSTGADAPDQAAVQRYAVAAGGVAGLGPVQPAGAAGPVVVLGASVLDDPMSDAAKNAVRDLRALPAPPGTEVLVGGFSAQVVDSVDSIVAKVPWMVLILVGATLVLMFLAFGSILLPVKAVVMSVLSLSATFGVLIWIFQDGHGAGLLNVTPQPVQAGMMVLIGAIVFGLSTDYETFLLSRMVEARNSGMSSRDAVRTGLLRTGRMISAAALLLTVVTGAFGMSSLLSMRFIGVGMVVALVLDATVVRMTLVPAVLRLLGDAAWWAPKSLRRLQQRIGFSESAAPAPEEKEKSLV